MTQIKSFKRNSIQFHKPKELTENLLRWLAENANTLGLLIYCVETTYQEGEKGDQVFTQLKKQALKTLAENCEEGDRIIHQKNLGSLVFYMSLGIARGLSITFGRYEARDTRLDAEQKKDIQAFIHQLQNSTLARPDLFQLPLLRMCLTIYALRKTLAGYTQQTQQQALMNNEYAILGFSNDSLVYRWAGNNDIFRVNLSHAFGAEAEIHLSVIKPIGNPFQENDVAQLSWRLTDEENKLIFYDRSALSSKKNLGNKKKNNDYKHYSSHIIKEKDTTQDAKYRLKSPEEIEKELKKQLSTRMVNEVFWNAQLEEFLTEANIAHSRLLFSPGLSVRMPQEQHEKFVLSTQPMGADLSALAKTHQRKNGYSFRYALMADPGGEAECEELRGLLTEVVKKLNEKKLNKKAKPPQLHLKEVTFSPKLSQTDLVIDIKTDAQDTVPDLWKNAPQNLWLDYYGQDRKQTIQANTVGGKQLISSFLFQTEGAVEVLYRSVTDLLLKKWLRSSPALRYIQASLTPLPRQHLLIMGTRLWRQTKSTQTPTPYNIFTAFYAVELGFDSDVDWNVMHIKEPQLNPVWNANKSTLQKSGFLSYLTQTKATQTHAQRLYDLVNAIPNNTALLARLQERFLNHGITYLFEIEANSILAVWEIIPEHNASLIPDFQYDLKKEGAIYAPFLTKSLENGAFSREENLSQIIENKRLVKEAEYEIQYSGNEVLIARKIYSEQQNTNRVLLQRIHRIYDAKASEELTEHDLRPILAGLITDAGTSSQLSGAKQSFYEKLIKLMISD